MFLFSCYQLTDTVQHVARIMHCAAKTNLTMSDTVVMRLTEELLMRLNSLIKELSTAVSINRSIYLCYLILTIKTNFTTLLKVGTKICASPFFLSSAEFQGGGGRDSGDL